MQQACGAFDFPEPWGRAPHAAVWDTLGSGQGISRASAHRWLGILMPNCNFFCLDAAAWRRNTYTECTAVLQSKKMEWVVRWMQRWLTRGAWPQDQKALNLQGRFSGGQPDRLRGVAKILLFEAGQRRNNWHLQLWPDTQIFIGKQQNVTYLCNQGQDMIQFDHKWSNQPCPSFSFVSRNKMDICNV